MRDNFDLKGYLRHGNKLLNEGIGGYKDIKPMKEMDIDSFVGAQRDTVDFQGQFKEDIKNLIAHIKDGYGTIGLDYVQQAWEAFSDIPFDTVEDKVVSVLSKVGIISGDEEPTSLEEFMGTAMEDDEDQYDGVYDAELGPDITNELEKPENIYADDEEENIEYDSSDRIMDLGGEQIEQGIISLLDDGFEPTDILELCRNFIDDHSQGNNY